MPLSRSGKPAQKSGIELPYVDHACPCARRLLPAPERQLAAQHRDPSRTVQLGRIEKLSDTIQPQLRTLIEDCAAKTPTPPTTSALGDLYAAFMDEARPEQLGVAPLAGELARIAALSDKQLLAARSRTSPRNWREQPVGPRHPPGQQGLDPIRGRPVPSPACGCQTATTT